MEKILDFCEISRDTVKEFEGIKKYIATGDIIDNQILSFQNVTYKNKPSRANQNVHIGDVLFAKMKDTLKVIVIDKTNVNNIFSTGFFVIKPKENVESKFLYWLFNSNEFNNQKDKYCKGATQKALNNDGLSKIIIRKLPELKEQIKIVKKIDKIQEIINIRKEQIEKLDEIIKSEFIKMFGDIITNSKGWKTIKLDEISIIKSGGTPSRNHPEYFKGNIPWITTVALGKNIINNRDAVEYITKEAVEKSATKIIPENSLLFGTRIGVGKISINSIPICTNQDIVAIMEIDNRFRILFLKKVIEEYSEYFNKQKRGATIQGIASITLKKIEIPIIEHKIQDKFIEIVKQIDKQKSKIQNNLEKMQNLKESLMNKYFC